jgi:hypothetical protein
MVEAEVRSLYFGELASRYSKRKHIISGATFFLSSGAAATLAGKAPAWLPLVLAVITAVLTAYAIAVGLEKKVAALAKLHYQWNHLAADYEQLWYHWYDDGAESRLEQLLKRDREASEAGTTEAPLDDRLIEKWQDRVNELHGMASA